MALPHQAKMKEDASGVPLIPLRQRPYAEVAGGRPSLLEGAIHMSMCGAERLADRLRIATAGRTRW